MGVYTETIWNHINQLMLDDAVDDIYLNGPNAFFYKRNGVTEQIPLGNTMSDVQYGISVIQALVQYGQLEIDPHGYLDEGVLRVSAPHTEQGYVRARCHVLPSKVVEFPVVTIVKQSTIKHLNGLASRGTMAAEMLSFLKFAVQAKLTMMVAGKTGAGKTTLMGAMCNEISNDERLVLVEDVPEITLRQPNTVTLLSEVEKPGQRKEDLANLDWCVRQGNRMRGDRLFVGEARGPEIEDWFAAVSSGQVGSILTIHAETAEGAANRASELWLKNKRGNTRVVNRTIADTVDLIVQMKVIEVRNEHGQRVEKRVISEIAEVAKELGSGEDARLKVTTLYEFDQQLHQFFKVGQMSHHLRTKLMGQGYNNEVELFTKKSPADRNKTRPLEMYKGVMG